MPWKECSVMDERTKFIGRLLEGESMSAVCREFGISRKTGYKIWSRYQSVGLEGLTDRSRRPYHQKNELPLQIRSEILRIKKEKPSWGAIKIREKLRRRFADFPTPAKSTIHALLDKEGLVRKRKRKRSRHRAEGTALSKAHQPNALWCADYKGEFQLGNKTYCYPLTITDFSTRYLITCESLENTKEQYAFSVFESAFMEYGLPQAIRTDNGTPFASAWGLFGLTKLSVWWLRLGIELERIKPGQPQQNGRHERMHRTLKAETTKPAAYNHLQQQSKFDQFAIDYNQDRPHQALGLKYPAELYQASERTYQGLPELHYPHHDLETIVTRCGRICFGGKKINLSQVFASQKLGLKQTDETIWLVSFMDYDLGYFDDESGKFEPLENPFGPKLVE